MAEPNTDEEGDNVTWAMQASDSASWQPENKGTWSSVSRANETWVNQPHTVKLPREIIGRIIELRLEMDITTAPKSYISSALALASTCDGVQRFVFKQTQQFQSKLEQQIACTDAQLKVS